MSTRTSTLDHIADLRAQAEAEVARAASTDALEELRVRWLGRKAELPNLLRTVAELPPEERGAVGRAANEARQAITKAIEDAQVRLGEAELQERLERDRVDVTLPGAPPQPVGRLHLLTATRREIEDVFLGLGFRVMEGPEVETVYNNFDALNHGPTHPARDKTDTFYTADGAVLRTHTSPMQIRAMKAHDPPLYVVIPGRTYRRDNDATHTPQFHQVEGLAVDEDITLADLKGTLLAFARAIFGEEREIRLRPHFFPFTEPSVEIDISCFMQHVAGTRCPVCKDTGWLEILGSGMVDPNVFAHVGYDPERVTGFAFGMGIERIAMLKHGIPDLRLLYDPDLRVLEQFG
jgi:phenylalanyl-tRNA synthetase alpha chain